jgi:thymidylate synthase (FAD)
MRGFLAGLDDAYVAYLDDPTPLPGGAQVSKAAAQGCYESFSEKRSFNASIKTYFDNIKEQKHGSVLQHPSITFLFYGIPISSASQITRYGHLSPSQKSYRYVSKFRFVERIEFQEDEVLHSKFIDRIDRTIDEYNELSQLLLTRQRAGTPILSGEKATDLRKKRQQAARAVLPADTETFMTTTGDPRIWRVLFEERASEHADIETRIVAFYAYLCLMQIEPHFFDDYEIEALDDGTYALNTEYRKV